MKKINLLNVKKNPKIKRYVGSKLRSISNRINSTYRDKRLFDGSRNDGYGGFKYDGRWIPIARKLCNKYKLNNKSKIIQLSCEKGFLLNDIKNLFPQMKINGVEQSDYAIKNSMKSVKKFIIKGNQERLKLYKKNHFDFLLAIGVVYALNLTDAIKCIKEINRVSKNSFINLASYKTKRDYWLFKQWSLLGTTILLEQEWVEILKHCKYKGDYYFTNAENLNLIQV